ncbi:hypothetical protein [uncultured Draconibacterium sp.]|uniref:hypothetical protein n=1 Tax=uncultured Draconibacterium sp. TaxID=1573823 RepID=UPI0029C918CB|nr:hypothetical protein [uncultured Draconibacterium sp.]
MKKLLLLFLLLSLFACNDDPDNPDVLIEYGTECGWGAGEIISISENKIDYSKSRMGVEGPEIESKSKSISADEWSELSNLYDYSFFQTLDYQSMNISFDGCDEIIRISNLDNQHEIRYDPSTEIEGLESFQERLNELLIEMRDY